MRGLLTAALTGSVMLVAGPGSASVLVTLDDDGTGSSRFTMSGTFDVTGGLPLGPPPAGGPESIDEFYGDAAADHIGWVSFSSLPDDLSARLFSRNVNINPILTGSDFSTPSLLSIDKFSLSLNGNSDNPFASIVAASSGSPGILNESGIYGSVPFSSFNSGVWEWGDYGTPNQGVRLEIGQAVAPVPLPGTLGLLAGALALLGGVQLRQRGRRQGVSAAD
jgi:hypothetical protein